MSMITLPLAVHNVIIFSLGLPLISATDLIMFVLLPATFSLLSPSYCILSQTRAQDE